jgi:regulator of protease activity HflC (stomatin/prohibitin superfamily)
MSAFWKLYFKTALVAIPAVIVLFGLVPSFVSAKDTTSVVLGLCLLLVVPWIVFKLFTLFRAQHDTQAIYERAKAKIAKARSVTPLLLVMALAPMFGGCGVVVDYWSVPAGNVLVVVNKYGSDKGIDSTEVRGPGRYWLTWNQEGHLFPTFVQSPKWTADTNDDYKDLGFSCSVRDGMVVGVDIGAQYEFVPDKIPLIFSKYRRGADELSDTVVRQLVADALVTECSKISVEAAYGAGREELLNKVQEHVVRFLDPIGVRVLTLNWLGKPRLPPQIEASITAKIEATQKAMTRENQLQETKAQANIDREKASGEADAKRTAADAEAYSNTVVSKSLTPELVKYRALDKWNGELPRISGAGPVPFVDVSGEAKKQ